MSPDNTGVLNSNQAYGFGIRDVKKVDRTDTRGTDNGGKVVRKAGVAIQSGGIAMQAAGNTAKAAGAGLTAVGAGLSATGAGAIVGAPMMAAGRIMGVGGSAVSAGGQAVSGAGRSVRRSGAAFRLAGRGGMGTKIKTIVRLPLDLTSFLFVSWLGTLWVIQFALAVLSIVMLGVGGGLEATFNIRLFGSGASVSDLLDLLRTLFGFNFNIADHFGSLFMLFSVMVLMIGFISLILVALRSILSLQSPFWGRGAALKISTFLGAIFLYTVPIANFFPWVALWALVLIIYRD